MNSNIYINPHKAKIVSIGGGPGNDALAAFFVFMKKSQNFLIEIHDLNEKAWKETQEEIFLNFFKNYKISFDWLNIDHSKDFEGGSFEADIIVLSWTINESVNFNLNFW